MGRRRLGHLCGVAVLVVCAVTGPRVTETYAGAAPVAEPSEPPPTRVMVLGDSVSHASVGERSWRYFAWQHLVGSGAAVDFVGPFRDPYVAPGETWPAVYADPDFDQDHASVWGDSFVWPRHDWALGVQWFVPDVVVLGLGTNDLVLYRKSPRFVLTQARTRLEQLRVLQPEVDVVLLEAARPDLARVRRYNELLVGLAAESSTTTSRVVVASPGRTYRTGRDDDAVADTYDEVHPNTRGQVKIAAGVVDALVTLGLVRPYPRPLAFPAEGPRTAPVLRARSRDRSVRLRWTLPPGATSFDVWTRAVGRRWVRAVRAHPRTTYRVRRMVPCHPHEVKVRARKGWTLAAPDVASPVLRVLAGPRVTDRARVTARGGLRRVAVRWSAVAGACRYAVRTVHLRDGRRVVRQRVVSGRRVVVRHLPRAVTVQVRVRGLGAQGEGPWSPTRLVRTTR